MSKNIDAGVWGTSQRARCAVAIAYLLSIILCIPVCLGLSISEVKNPFIQNLMINSTNIGVTNEGANCSIVFDVNQSTLATRKYVVDISVPRYPTLEPSIFCYYR